MPYVTEARWKGEGTAESFIDRLAAHLLPSLRPNAIVVLVSDKGQKGAFTGYARLEKITAGKRRIVILRATHRSAP